MANVSVKVEKFKLNGLKLVTSQTAFNAVQNATGRITKNANSAGHGKYIGDTIRGGGRMPHGLVHTADYHSMYGERKYNTLLNSLR